MLLQKPHEFFAAVIPGIGEFDDYGVAQIFFPNDFRQRMGLKALVERTVREEGFEVVAWREVPTENRTLGKTALLSEPAIWQLFVRPREPLPLAALDARLYVLRRLIEKATLAAKLAPPDDFYICSLDRRKIVYKGLLTCGQLRPYFPDLSDGRVQSALVLLHSRFSTNTLGAWHLAHPYRCIVHNGEINTLRGNVNRMKTREAVLASPVFGADIERIKPIISEGTSDTAVLDSVLELLLESRRSLPHALRMLIPEAWEKDRHIDPRRRAFYDYHSTLIEPWDGPALVAATDGTRVAAALDRNGLRPCRYCVTKDNRLIMASEAGVLETPASEIVFQGRLKPGELFLADTREGRIIPEDEIFAGFDTETYVGWLEQHRVKLSDLVAQTDVVGPPALSEAIPAITQVPAHCPMPTLSSLQRAFGYTLELLRVLVQPMAEIGKDPVGAMGNDAPPAALSAQRKQLFQYFHQLFAQVSNPPLDYIREDLVTSLQSHTGRQHNLLAETAEHCRQLFLESPILTDHEIEAIHRLEKNGIRSCLLDITFAKSRPLREAIEEMRAQAIAGIEEDREILVLTDRAIGPERVAIPSLLAIGAVHHHLIRKGLRTRAGLVMETGQPCAVHHFCTLIGYGADAVHPWLAYRSIAAMITDGLISTDAETAIARFREAVQGGILKVMSKMGISTLESYKGAQVFQTIGLDFDFVDEFFAGTVAHIPGIGLAQIEAETLDTHALAFSETTTGSLELEQGGEHYWRRDGELHQWNPWTIGKFQQAARTGDYAAYIEFASWINDQQERLQTLRGLLDFNIEPRESVPLQEVEPVAEIVKRFATGSMSFGALSLETHETLAVAMNRLGGKSGSGEGGEQVDRFGTERENTMKQVASGRFGATINYLVNARQIEIKMAQGSKPGEGGELPGTKVDDVIAEVRFTTPGVGLISPPPHHDIYSIEDLAQLIHDLKCANPRAEIHVKLVSVANVGTIAAGVAKARADAVLISGDSGGTGASVKTSIKAAGAPWELGLAETQQVLLANNLRSRIRVRVDGGLKTGRDVVVAALLGAEEFGFGTSALVALGCIMLRKCHCNTCSVGIATQDPRLRALFPGRPEHVINYLRFVAQETRELMATLGFRTIDETIGRVEKLRPRDVRHSRGLRLDLSQLLHLQPSPDAPRKIREQNHKLEKKIDHRIIEQARPAIERGEPVCIKVAVRNGDRTLGTLLSSELTRRHGAGGLPPDTIRVVLRGSAGQSFGAFLAPGISLFLEGEANDYVGKGLSGGKIIVSTPPDAGFVASDNIIIGNVALYGATSGEAYFNGMAGERFAVRNSGALAVVEGIGDHGCEYMTGGVVVVLGSTGKNFGAGMSGGEAFIYDDACEFATRMNGEMVHIEDFTEERDRALVRRMIENQLAYTRSSRARKILENWDRSAACFVKVIPDAYAEAVARWMREGRDVRAVPPPKPAELRQAA
jgi:glutamate synthase (NADPH/NADH) large chain